MKSRSGRGQSNPNRTNPVRSDSESAIRHHDKDRRGAPRDEISDSILSDSSAPARNGLREGVDPEAHPKNEISPLAAFFGLTIDGARRDLKPSQGDTPGGAQDGDNCAPEGRNNEPEREPRSGTETGTDANLVLDEDSELKNLADEIVRRHNAARILLRSKADYEDTFRNFVKVTELEGVTLRDFKKNMKEYIKVYLSKKRAWSHKTRLSELKSYVLYGFELPWPIDPKIDVGDLPKYRKRTKPRDDIVDRWLKKIDTVDDLYNRLFLLFHFEFGFRAHSHMARLRWGDIRCDVNGDPISIVVQSEEFKTFAPIVANIPPYLRIDLRQWRDRTPFGSDNDLVFPWRSASGSIEQREHSRSSISDYWKRLEKNLELETLGVRPVHLRHWVKTQMRRADVKDVLSEVRCGRDPKEQYDTPDTDEILADLEEQLPNGVLGFYRPSKVQLTDDLPREWTSLYYRWMEGTIRPSEAMDEMFTLRERRKMQENRTLEP